MSAQKSMAMTKKYQSKGTVFGGQPTYNQSFVPHFSPIDLAKGIKIKEFARKRDHVFRVELKCPKLWFSLQLQFFLDQVWIFREHSFD